jgi:hypothetical protein
MIQILKKRWLPFAVLCSIFLLSFLLSVNQAASLPLCFFHWITHLDCPGCGLSRSFISISHGHLIQAVRFNALGPLVYLFFAIAMVRCFLPLREGNPSLLPTFESRWSYFLFAILFWGQWILKLIHEISLNNLLS